MTHAPPQYLIFTPSPQGVLLIRLYPLNVPRQTNSETGSARTPLNVNHLGTVSAFLGTGFYQ